jgi:hypothetical protein
MSQQTEFIDALEEKNDNIDMDGFQKYVKAVSKDSFLLKNLKKYVEDFYCKHTNFAKYQINNWLEFTCPTMMFTDIELNSIRNYHSLIIMKKKKLSEWVSSNMDINPQIQIFLNVSTPFKSFEEVSLEYKLPLELIQRIGYQVHKLGFGKIVNRFTNSTILNLNPNYQIKVKIEIEFKQLYNIDIYETLNFFIFKKSLNGLFKKRAYE